MASKLVQFQPMNLLTSSACSVIKRIVRVALCYRLMQLWHFSRAYKPPAGIYNWAGRRTLTVNRLFKTKVQRFFSLLWNKEKGVKQTCSNLVRWFSRLLQYPGFHLKNKSTKAYNNLKIYSAKDRPCRSATELQLNLMWVANHRFHVGKKKPKHREKNVLVKLIAPTFGIKQIDNGRITKKCGSVDYCAAYRSRKAGFNHC